MSKMSDLSIEIEEQLTKGVSPYTVAQRLQVPVSWVYDVQDRLYEDLPNGEYPSDEEIDRMAEYYGYGVEVSSEFDKKSF